MTPHQREVLDKAFTTALEMAQIANQPRRMSAATADMIFAKYFPIADKAAVIRVFKKILGNTYPRQGHPGFANVTVDMANTKGICPPESSEPGRASVLHEFTHHDFVQKNHGGKIKDFDINPGPGSILITEGPGVALFTNEKASTLSKLSAANYQWRCGGLLNVQSHSEIQETAWRLEPENAMADHVESFKHWRFYIDS
ncbi:MAG: hypothetical protein Q9221_003290 [Calogaya cf. arnoldii]